MNARAVHSLIPLIVVVCAAGIAYSADSDARIAAVATTPAAEPTPEPTPEPERRSTDPYKLRGQPVIALPDVHFKVNRRIPRRSGGDTEVRNVRARLDLDGRSEEFVAYDRGRYCYLASLLPGDDDEPDEVVGQQRRLKIYVRSYTRPISVLVRLAGEGEEVPQIRKLCGR